MNGYNYNSTNKGAMAKRLAVLFAPFVFFAAAVALLSVFFMDTLVFGNPLWNTFFVEDTVAVENTDGDYLGAIKLKRPVEPQQAEDVVAPVLPPVEDADTHNYLDELPPLTENAYLPYGSVGGFSLGDYWADISVHDDAKLNDIPVYQGDNPYILTQGVGHLYGSSFPGEGGVCVLAAHVRGKLGFFGNISKGELYKKGTQVKLDTAYGTYVYEVVDTAILNYQDEKFVRKYVKKGNELVNNYQALTESYGADELLVMYTCYPLEAAFRTERFYVVCRRIYGYSWR